MLGSRMVGDYMKKQFAEGKPFRNQLTEIKNVGAKYDEFMTPAAQEMQEALMRLTGKIPLGTGNQSKLAGTLDRAAASPEMLQLLKYLPAGAVGTAGLATAGDLVFGEEDFGNKAMDSLVCRFHCNLTPCVKILKNGIRIL